MKGTETQATLSGVMQCSTKTELSDAKEKKGKKKSLRTLLSTSLPKLSIKQMHIGFVYQTIKFTLPTALTWLIYNKIAN